jgi:nucleolar GTP-binding protein
MRAFSADVDFRKIPTIMSADEIIDRAFRRAGRVTIMERDPIARAKGNETARIRTVQNIADSTLERYVKKFGNFDELDPFYADLVGVVINVDHVRKSLGAITWARQQINRIGDQSVAKIKAATRDDRMAAEKRHAFGRISSVLKQVDGDLKRLNAARDALRHLPAIDPTVPTIVVAGYPNVGKSSLVRRVSSGTPEVAPYPFTTKELAIGHFEKRRIRYQIIDTPGVLDRPMDERNPIEIQAVLALKHLADAVIFVLDPSERCGYSLKEQNRLLDEVRRLFPDAPLLIAENKADVGEGTYSKSPDRFITSTETGDGVDELMKAAVKAASPKAELPSRR